MQRDGCSYKSWSDQRLTLKSAIARAAICSGSFEDYHSEAPKHCQVHWQLQEANGLVHCNIVQRVALRSLEVSDEAGFRICMLHVACLCPRSWIHPQRSYIVSCD